MKPTIVVSTPGGDPFKKLARFEIAVYEGAADAVTEACLLTKSLAQTTLRDLGRIDRGTLRNTINVTVTKTPGIIRGVVSADAFYAIWVEFGRLGRLSSPAGTTKESATAAWPSVAAISAWVSRNLARLRADKKTSTESLVFLIGRKIAERGIAPTPFMRPAEARVRPRFQSMLVRHVLNRRAALGV